MTEPLPLGLTAEALEAAAAEADPGSLAAGTRLRARFGPELATAALNQAALRRRARAKFGDAAAGLFLTRDGLEQATRPAVADLHARRFATAGVRRVVDLGCGIGSDALAVVRAGLDVVAVERDPGTAELARANLAAAVRATGGRGGAEVVVADVADVLAGRTGLALGPDDGVFADPARRDARGRVWRTQDFSPDLSLLLGLAAPGRVLGVKLGPALPHGLVPPGAEAEWVSHDGDVVEVGVWSGPGSEPGRRSALLWPDRRLVADPAAPPLAVRDVGAYVHEPDGAVIRAGAVPVLGAALGAGLLADQVAYLTSDEPVPTPYATTFAVQRVLPYDLKVLRRWVREADVGALEVKRRGLDLDPAQLRRNLKPRGRTAATLLLSRTPTAAVALVVSRVAGTTPEFGGTA